MKKIFAQPEMMVVNINKNDVIATSTLGMSNEAFSEENKFGSADRFRDWND